MSDPKSNSNIEGAMVRLRTSPLLSEAFARDEMAGEVVLQRSLPGRGTDELENDAEIPRVVRDTDVLRVQEYLQRHGLTRLSKATTHDAVDLRAAERPFHPVRDWLSSLEWDKQTRLADWLSNYLGAERTPYTSAIGAMFLTAMVARIFEPGAKADYMLVLEGKQGARKSMACSILGGRWFSDNLPDITEGKDVSQHLRGKWLVEIAEMSAMSKADHAALKAFISRPIERYRPTYGRREVVEPRRCVFIGTTNKTRYLRDETGGRRYWPVRVGAVDIERLAADRNQLFAEAVAQFQSGARWWPDAVFEAEHIKPEQDERFEADVWQYDIADFLVSRSHITVGEIAERVLDMPRGRIATQDSRRIAACLEHLGWERGKKDRAGRIRWESGLRQ